MDSTETAQVLTSAEILSLAEKVFFRAMLAGYLGGDKSKGVRMKTRDLNGNETTITYAEEDFVVIDRYYTTPGSNASVGLTLILFKGNPVWWMSYNGEYPKEVIPFLKSALAEAYREGEFNGGRGKVVFSKHKEFEYFNDCSGHCLFQSFYGLEKIVKKENFHNWVGYHKYHGGSMI
jgi:hypothetical protein